MCAIISIPGEEDISTPGEFQNRFNFSVIPFIEEYYEDVDLESCLCQIDVEKALKFLGLRYKIDCGDYHITEIPKIYL